VTAGTASNSSSSRNLQLQPWQINVETITSSVEESRNSTLRTAPAGGKVSSSKQPSHCIMHTVLIAVSVQMLHSRVLPCDSWSDMSALLLIICCTAVLQK
jgi:hypothetical protein